MAAQPGGLCGPGVRSEGSRNTAEPCTRLPGAGRRCPSRLLGPRTCGGPRRFSPPARHPASGSAVTPALPRAFPALARGSWAAGPAIAEPPAPRLRGSVAGVQPLSPRTPPRRLCASTSWSTRPAPPNPDPELCAVRMRRRGPGAVRGAKPGAEAVGFFPVISAPHQGPRHPRSRRGPAPRSLDLVCQDRWTARQPLRSSSTGSGAGRAARMRSRGPRVRRGCVRTICGGWRAGPQRVCAGSEDSFSNVSLSCGFTLESPHTRFFTALS
jgi:hypothetical protein